VITVGVDLSTASARTATCVIEWDGPGAAHGVKLVLGATDEDIVRLAGADDVIAIDAPFGWPRGWAEAVAAHRPGAVFAADGASSVLTSRETDRWIERRVGVRPLAVGANLIGATAIRCARLVHRLGRSVDVGASIRPPFVTEVYPAAALRRWGFSYQLYRGKTNTDARALLIEQLIRAGLPVAVTEPVRSQLAESDDALDALIASLVGRAVALGLAEGCPEELTQAAREEGWIRVPRASTTLGALK
jgi:hypothetical protein